MGRTSNARQRLMDAAYALICEYSYGAVTIEAICERAAVKKGSFYYFFDSKSDLAVASIDAWWTERKALIQTIFLEETPPVARLKKYFDFIKLRQLQIFEKNGQVLGCPLFTLGAEISTQDERLRRQLHGMLDDLVHYFSVAIAEAQVAGDIPGRNAAGKGRSLVSFYEGLLTRARIENNPDALRTLTEDAMDILGVREPVAA